MSTVDSVPVVTRDGDMAAVEWDVKVGDRMAWDALQLERSSDGSLLISDREYGPVEIPGELVGLVMSLVAELIPEAVAS